MAERRQFTPNEMRVVAKVADRASRILYAENSRRSGTPEAWKVEDTEPVNAFLRGIEFAAGAFIGERLPTTNLRVGEAATYKLDLSPESVVKFVLSGDTLEVAEDEIVQPVTTEGSTGDFAVELLAKTLPREKAEQILERATQQVEPPTMLEMITSDRANWLIGMLRARSQGLQDVANMGRGLDEEKARIVQGEVDTLGIVRNFIIDLVAGHGVEEFFDDIRSTFTVGPNKEKGI